MESLPSDPDERPGPASGPRPVAPSPHDQATRDLYAQHWRYVRSLLFTYGIPSRDADDVAQTVWLYVHRKRDSFDTAIHKTTRAWITGFVQRCAANHLRTERRRGLILIEDIGEAFPALGMDAEQTAMLRDLCTLIPNEDQRVALLLQVRHGLSNAEIAAVQEVTESAVEWRLHMARRTLKNGDEKNRGAFLGFGSLEALAEALKPKPIPDEVGEQEWKRIAERIEQEGASPSETDPPPSPPASSLPPAVPALVAPAVPALVAPAAAAPVTIGVTKLAILLGLAFGAGAGTGAGSVLVWQAHQSGRHGHAAAAMDRGAAAATASSSATTTTAAPSTSSSSTTAARTAPSSSAARTAPSTSTPTRPAASSSPSAAPSTSTSSTAAASTAPSAATLDEGGSRRLLSRMRDSMDARQFSVVLSLAEQHARQFGATHVGEREAFRIEALRETGRLADAEQQARAVITTYPEHRRAMERAAGHALP